MLWLIHQLLQCLELRYEKSQIIILVICCFHQAVNIVNKFDMTYNTQLMCVVKNEVYLAC